MADQPNGSNVHALRAVATGDAAPPLAAQRWPGAALDAMNLALVGAIEAAKTAGVPQGLVVALLHGYAHQQTAAMMARASA